MANAASKKQPPVARSIKSLRESVAQWRKRGVKVALVPTMGALHEGHISLVQAARKRARRVVVSIFVNPTQFGPNEDFSRYPRTFEADLEKLGVAGADLIFAPAVSEIYPDGFATRIVPEGPAAAGLDDKFRPGHFSGVATVVAKLLTAVMPDFAAFGQKDYQQLQVIKTMVRDLHLPVQIIGAPIIREKDGLALSSRNIYLSAEDRAAAPTLHAALRECAKAIKAGAPVEQALAAARERIASAGFAIDYMEARNAQTLAPATDAGADGIRLLVAAKIGATRLIDNLAV